MVETRSKSTVFRVYKRDGRAGEIRTRGLLVPNQALCRAKLPPVFFDLVCRVWFQTANVLSRLIRASRLEASDSETAAPRFATATKIMWPSGVDALEGS